MLRDRPPQHEGAVRVPRAPTGRWARAAAILSCTVSFCGFPGSAAQPERQSRPLSRTGEGGRVRMTQGAAMSTYRLDKLFAPRSVALGRRKPARGSLGAHGLRNLREAGFPGRSISSTRSTARSTACPASRGSRSCRRRPTSIVIATPPATSRHRRNRGRRMGAARAIVTAAGLGHGEGSLAKAAAAARRTGCAVGPNCLGVLARRRSSTPASPPACRRPATSRSSRNRAPSRRA